jgi:hypothetical protein
MGNIDKILVTQGLAFSEAKPNHKEKRFEI